LVKILKVEFTPKNQNSWIRKGLRKILQPTDLLQSESDRAPVSSRLGKIFVEKKAIIVDKVQRTGM
jgi:hypothetical protein